MHWDAASEAGEIVPVRCRPRGSGPSSPDPVCSSVSGDSGARRCECVGVGEGIHSGLRGPGLSLSPTCTWQCMLVGVVDLCPMLCLHRCARTMQVAAALTPCARRGRSTSRKGPLPICHLLRCNQSCMGRALSPRNTCAGRRRLCVLDVSKDRGNALS